MSNQMIQITFLIIGIIVLAYMGVLAQKRVKIHEDMSVGGRTFNAWSIFFSLFAFWGGNTIASIVELAHRDGIASAWFGIARMTMFVLILFITGGAFRKLAMITLSDFISQRFESPFLRLLSGIIIALNFTIFTVSSVVGASAFFTAILGWSVWASVMFTVVSFLVYTTLGGMHALSYNGKILTVGQLLALLVAAVVGVNMAGWDNIMRLEPRYFDVLPDNYIGTTMMWFFTFVTNAFVAQAALQIVMSCKTINEGRKGIIYVALGFIPIIVLAPLAGMAAKVLFPAVKSVQAMPMLASSMPSAILSTIVVLGLYFTTLGWASSCILSGGTVAANDIYRYFVPNASSDQLIRASRISIIILSVLTVGFAILIPSGVEFWTIVGFVLRNTGLFPLILIGLFWSAISKKAAIAAAIAGSSTGIVWYLIKFPSFLFNAHPMFVGMVVSIIVVILGTFLEYRGQMRFSSSPTGILFGLAGCAGAVIAMALAAELIRMKLMAACISFTMSFFFVAVIFLVKRVEQSELAVEAHVAAEKC
ncbi:MAG: sodium:solute symporter family protein [Bacillota bacterium]